MKHFCLFLSLFFLTQLHSQTIVMNEVSNGPTGNQEYVEFVVVSSSVTYTCSNTTPPCIDIRGWIFDDNSGYHGGTTGTGVAPGAIRFSQSPVWACVPLGTIILIYNNLDRNPAIPPDDLSMTDGNCTIIAPVNDANLFETNATTPGAIACSYPSTGWTAVGSWTTTLLANTGDCARIVNLAGCEVFSVCYGTANTNNLIYFTGSGGQTVYYFNGTDPMIQGNWSSATVSGNQTPGAPNNALNAAYIAQFNNNCTPITPISLPTPTVVNAGCSCNGSATASASGSIPGYTYVWYNSAMNPIGQNSATATGLCAGVYYVTATSHIGCSETKSVTVGSTGSSSITVTANSTTLCAGSTATLSANVSSPGGTYLWSPGGQTTPSISVSPSGSTTYTVNYTLGACSGSATAMVTVGSAAPTLTIISTNTLLCSGQSATLSLNGSTGTYNWSTGATSPTIVVNSFGAYSATVTNSCGQATSFIQIAGGTTPTIAVTPGTAVLCPGMSATLTASGNLSNYQWSTGAGGNQITVSTPGVYTVGISNVCGTATASVTVTSFTLDPLVISASSYTICPNETATLTASGGGIPGSPGVSYTWSNSTATGPVTITSGGTITVSATNSCGTYSQSIVIYNFPVNAAITANPLSGVKPLTVTFTNGSTSATTYSWIFGNGNTAVGFSVSPQTYSAAGDYTASITVTDGVCSDQAFVVIHVLNETPELLIPNVFTPNNDLVNDVFKVKGYNISNFHAAVYDRWGLELFNWSDVSQGWDGKVNGNLCHDGTYFYIISCKDADNKDIKKQGSFTLLR